LRFCFALTVPGRIFLYFLCEKVLLNTKEIVKEILTPVYRQCLFNQLLVVGYAGYADTRGQTDVTAGMGADTIPYFTGVTRSLTRQGMLPPAGRKKPYRFLKKFTQSVNFLRKR
jgi:hypothetical protein